MVRIVPVAADDRQKTPTGRTVKPFFIHIIRKFLRACRHGNVWFLHTFYRIDIFKTLTSFPDFCYEKAGGFAADMRGHSFAVSPLSGLRPPFTLSVSRLRRLSKRCAREGRPDVRARMRSQAAQVRAKGADKVRIVPAAADDRIVYLTVIEPASVCVVRSS